jgi:hypothetical protein
MPSQRGVTDLDQLDYAAEGDQVPTAQGLTVRAATSSRRAPCSGTAATSAISRSALRTQPSPRVITKDLVKT